MGNVFPIDRPVHERYDLKGSTRGRATSEAERDDPNVVLKDLDWIRAGRKLHLGADKKRRLLVQIKKDCALLERLERDMRMAEVLTRDAQFPNYNEPLNLNFTLVFLKS